MLLPRGRVQRHRRGPALREMTRLRENAIPRPSVPPQRPLSCPPAWHWDRGCRVSVGLWVAKRGPGQSDRARSSITVSTIPSLPKSPLARSNLLFRTRAILASVEARTDVTPAGCPHARRWRTPKSAEPKILKCVRWGRPTRATNIRLADLLLNSCRQVFTQNSLDQDSRSRCGFVHVGSILRSRCIPHNSAP